MRKPTYLSHSSLALWEKDREEFYLKHLAEKRPPRIPQQNYMSIGAAFDAYVKAELHEKLFGKGADPQFEFDTIFTEQVEQHNRDWAKEHGKHVFDCYVESGFHAELLAMLLAASDTPQFEFTIKGTIEGVPFVGKPDLRFHHELGAKVILDWKVRGYCSRSAASPTKNYRLCRDGYPPEAAGAKPSRSHGKAHKIYSPVDHHGLEIHTGYMEDGSVDYADQLSLYSWLLGEKVGDEDFVGVIDEIVSKPRPKDRPLLRVAQHRARIRERHQRSLIERAKRAWSAIESGHIFDDLPREESGEKCERLERLAVSLQTGDNFFNEIVRPQRR